jgi:hypothetical protein
MVNSRSVTDQSLLATVDLRAFLETLRFRWWVVPIMVALSIGFFVTQESRLQTEPASYYVAKSYQLPTPISLLGPVGINPALISEFPDLSGQLLILGSDEVKREIAAVLGKQTDVEIPPNYSSPFIFQCEAPEAEDCENAIDAYAERAALIRAEALTYSLETTRKVFEEIYRTTDDPIALSKMTAIDVVLKNLNTKLIPTDVFREFNGPTISTVGRDKYVFAVVAGLILAGLVLLQLTYSDSRVRSVRQLIRVVGDDSFLGVIRKKPNPVGDRRTAVALMHGLHSTERRGVRFIPLRHAISNHAQLTLLAETAGSSHAVSEPFSDMSVAEFVGGTSDQADVVLVQRNRDLRKDVVEALIAVQRSGRRLAGVLLID